MNNTAKPQRRAGGSDARVRRRYRAERRFWLAGLFAVGLSAAFLAFLLFTMAWKGLSGFTHYEAAIPVDFPRSDVMLDASALKGPQASDLVAGADLESVLVSSASATYGDEAAELFG